MELESSHDPQNLIIRDLERTRHDIGKVREDMDKLTKKLQDMAADIVSGHPTTIYRMPIVYSLCLADEYKN